MNQKCATIEKNILYLNREQFFLQDSGSFFCHFESNFLVFFSLCAFLLLGS